jgi:thymidylate synthase
MTPDQDQSDLLFGPSFQAASIDDAWLRVTQQLLCGGQRVGSRDGAALELLGCAFTLTSLERTLLLNRGRRLDPCYAAAETLWYVSGQDRIDMIRRYAPQYSRFAEWGRAWGAYGKRLCGSDLFRHQLNVTEQAAVPQSDAQGGVPQSDAQGGVPPFVDQLDGVVLTLRSRPDSRQAVVSLWNDGDLPHAVKGDKGDLPCTLSLQFLVRWNRLHLVATMRSNDVWLGLPYDVFAFTALQRVVAARLDLRPGLYRHQVASMHLYERDEAKARAAVTGEDDPTLLELSHDWLWRGTLNAATHARACLELEEAVRTGRALDQLSLDAVLDESTVLSDCLACCLTKLGGHVDTRYPSSPAMREGLKRKYLEPEKVNAVTGRWSKD